MKTKRTITDILFCIAAAVLTFGTKFIFHACTVMEGEDIMACHWAENAVTATGAVILSLAVLNLIFGTKRARFFLSLAAVPAAIVAILLPGTLIRLCMMDTMRCRAVMRPGVTVTAAVILVLCALHLFTERDIIKES